MNSNQEWNHFYSNGRIGGDKPGFDATDKAWDAFNSGREQRYMDRLVQMMSRPPESNSWFQNDT